MATYTVFTASDIGPIGPGGALLGGLTTCAATFSDNSDATYADFAPSGGAAFNLATATIPANEQIRSYRVVLRWKSGAANATQFYVLVSGTSGPSSSSSYSNYHSAFIDWTGPTFYTAPDGSTLTATSLARAFVYAYAGSPTHLLVSQFSIELTTNVAPSATVSAPTGTITTSARPTVTWSYSDPESDAQERYRVQILDAGSAVVWDSGEVFSAATSVAVGGALANGSYTASVSVSDAGSNGRYGAAGTSAFSILVQPNVAPTMTATWDGTNARVVLDTRAHDNLLDADSADIEGGVGAWVARTNCTLSRITSQFSSGSASLDIHSSGAGECIAAIAPASEVAVLSGRPYRGTAKVKSLDTARTVSLGLEWFKSDGTFISASSLAPITTNTSTFARGFVDATAPATAAKAVLTIRPQSTASADDFACDELGIMPGDSSSVTTWSPGGYVPSQIIEQEVSYDGGSTWKEFRPLYNDGSGHYYPLWALSLSGTEYAITYDYEVPRGFIAQYRARVSSNVPGVYTGSSVPSAPVSVTTGREQCAWIKDPLDPNNNISEHSVAMAIEMASLVATRTEPQGVHYALGRADPIVVHGTARSASWPMTLFFADDDAYEAWLGLQDLSHSLLFQSPWGDRVARQEYFSVGSDVQVEFLTTQNEQSAQFARVTFSAIGTGAP